MFAAAVSAASAAAAAAADAAADPDAVTDGPERRQLAARDRTPLQRSTSEVRHDFRPPC